MASMTADTTRHSRDAVNEYLYVCFEFNIQQAVMEIPFQADRADSSRTSAPQEDVMQAADFVKACTRPGRSGPARPVPVNRRTPPAGT
jgi:hypothetical protein